MFVNRHVYLGTGAEEAKEDVESPEAGVTGVNNLGLSQKCYLLLSTEPSLKPPETPVLLGLWLPLQPPETPPPHPVCPILLGSSRHFKLLFPWLHLFSAHFISLVSV